MNMNATILGQAIAFILFVWFCMKYVWPPLMAAIEKRQKEIADGLAAGEKGRAELEQSSKRAAEALAEAKQKASEILSLAEKRATQIVEDAKGTAKAEGDRIITGAKAEIEQEINRAKEGLRQQVSTLAIAGAEKILRKEIDAKAHSELLSKLAAEL